MHIAVMNDNVADRKQLERLLDRESDRRISTTGNLYIDSFGAVESFMQTPFQYDMFFVNIEGLLQENMKIVKDLRDLGVRVPICIIKKNFSSEVAQNALLFIEYPIKVSDLTAIIDKALVINKELEAEKKEEQIKEALELAEAEKKKSFIRKIFEKF